MLDIFFKTIEKIIPVKWRWVLNHDGFKRYFANTGWMFLGQMFSLLVAFFIGAWIARYLGPENYGILSYAIAFVGLFGFISSLGVDGILNRELIKYPEKRDELLGTAFYLKIFGGIVAFVLTVVSAFLFQSDVLIKLLVVIFSFTFLLQAINVINIYFQAEVRSKNNVKAQLLATLITSILKILVIVSGYGVVWFILVYVLDLLWQGLGFLKAYYNFGLKIKNWQFNKVLAVKLLKNSWPLMLASAANFIYIKIDQVMIGSLMGSYEVGLYAAAVKLVEVWYFIPIIICSSLFPAIVNAKKNNQEVYKQRLKNLYFLMIAVSVLMAVPITFLAKPIVYILFGSGYLESVSILRVYIWSSLGLFLGFATNQYLMSENLVKVIFWLNFLAMLINVALNFVFIPWFGLVGSAWATFVSYIFIPIGTLAYIKFFRKY